MQHAGHPVSRSHLDRGAEAADRLAPLENQHLATRPRETRRGGEAVLAGADDHGVEARRHTALASSMVRAQSAPGAPMMPPPGWVPEAHIHSPSMGVR